jgi:hypothetical protein
VPADLSVVGFDDIRFARHMDPPLTTIAQPMREIGEGTVRLLLDILNGHTVEPVSITLPHRLVIRGSTAPVKINSVGLPGATEPARASRADDQSLDRRASVETFRIANP